jgi:hypothetical protein
MVRLRDGTEVPALGMGTWHMAERGSAAAKAELAALKLGIELGVMLIDTAVSVVNDWVAFATNAVAAATPLSVVAINQTDASRQFSTQPFAAVGSPQSWSLSAITIDPLRSRIFTADALAGEVAALELRDDGLHKVWTAHQRTSEFLALIDQTQRRVLVGTDVPPGEPIGANTHDWVVWRNADTGDEIARPSLLPEFSTGTMVQPGYAGRLYYLGLDGTFIELKAHPTSEISAAGD